MPAALAFLLIAAGSPVLLADYVGSFDVRLELRPDASLDVTETITIRFESPRHGIYRFIPVHYDRYANAYTVDFRLTSITDGEGNRVRYNKTRQGRDINLKIGDPDIMLIGTRQYVIRYTVRRAVNFFREGPELYWNATGDQWPYPIRAARAMMIVPAGIDLSHVRTDCFVGPPGSTQRGVIQTGSDGIVFTSGPLPAGSGMTIVAGLPPGSVTRAGLAQRVLWFTADWWPVAAFPTIALLTVAWRWRTTGRDEGAGVQAVAVEFQPPKDLTPAEVGTLIDERCDTPDVVATLVDLAARGYLKIDAVEGQKLLFLSSRDYVFTRVRRTPLELLLPHEEQFLAGLFGSAEVARLSDLKEEFYIHIAPMKTSIYHELMSKGLFRGNPVTVRTAWRTAGILLAGGGLVLTLVLAGQGIIAYGIGMLLAGLVVASSARAMPAKTLKGTRRLIECLSFRRFVAMVEKDRIKEMAMDDPTVFGRLLPYAMVLGVADQWAEAFRDLTIPAPDWYTPANGRAFSPIWFTNDLGAGMRTMQKTFTSAPASSGSSGGSGGSGFSGGSSGGGFGGGGGGSW